MTQLELNPNLARQFLESLYGRYYSQATSRSYLEVRGRKETDPPGKMPFNRFYLGIDLLLKDMRKWEGDRNYWIGVALRKSNKGGKKADCLALPALYSDVDYGQDGHRKKTKWQTKSEALAAIQAFPLRPSILIHSGGGVQPYWLLKEPFGLENGNYAQVEAIMKGLSLALGGDVGTQDVSRILRLPGTFNMKLAGNPRPVEIEWCEPERVYSFSDFAQYSAQRQTTQDDKKRADSTGPQITDLEALNIPAWTKTLILTGAREGYPSRSERDHAVIGELFRAGCNLDTIDAIYQTHPVGEKYREKESQGRAYLQASFEKVSSQGKKWTYNATGGDWPEPQQLRRTPEPGEPFPVEALGAILGEAATAMHLNIKAPLAVCGQSVFAAANLAVQGHADVVIDGRQFPLSEFFMSIAISGDRKSAADRAALVGVNEHQKYILESYKRDLGKYNLEEALWKRDYEVALKKGDPHARREAVKSLPPAPTAPPYPQLTTEEPTYEGLCKLLAIGWPSVGIFSDEAGRFFGGHAMSQEHRLMTLAGLSNLWDGKPITRTRAGDGAMTLYGRRVCAHFLMQPMVAETILGDPLAHEQGFLSRCLTAFPESTLGEQQYQAHDLTRVAAYERCRSRLSEILKGDPPLRIDPTTGGSTNELILRLLPLAADAKAVWIEFHDWVQEHLHRDGIFRPISGIAAKAAEHALRLAGTLALIDNLNAQAISLHHVKGGITLARFYLTEALRIFHTAKTNPDLLVAEKVLAWLRSIEGSDKNLVSLPDIYQFGPNAVRDKATAMKIMEILSDHLWIKPMEGGAIVGGQKRRQVWEVSPYVFQGPKI